MYLLRSKCAQSSFAYSLVLNPRETRDSGIVVVLDFKKIIHYWQNNLLKQNVLGGDSCSSGPDLNCVDYTAGHDGEFPRD